MRPQTLKRIFVAVFGMFILFSCEATAQVTMVGRPMGEKPRLLVLTDIGGDPDDQQAMIRLSVYLNDFDLEGIIASASGIPGQLDKAIVQPQYIEEIIRAYGAVRPNLVLHSKDYPQMEDVLRKIKRGNPNRGWDFVDKGHDTEGSEWIIATVDKEDARPLYIAIWGGQTDLAQALWKVRDTRSEAAYQAFVQKIRVYDIDDQDNIQARISKQFPGLFYILAKAPKGHDKRNGVYRGMYLGGDESLTSLDWINAHVAKGHGPLGALYPLKTWTAPNPNGVMKEGDSPSWFYFLSNGLSDPGHPGWGGWGGRFAQGPAGFIDAQDSVNGIVSARATVWRWRPQFQNDFAARMDWCVKPYDAANHNPVAAIDGNAGKEILAMSAKPGEPVSLKAYGSTDPDGNGLVFHWFVYKEAGTYLVTATIANENAQKTSFTIPEDATTGQTIHVVLEVTDDGTPSLCSYRRVVITVK